MNTNQPHAPLQGKMPDYIPRNIEARQYERDISDIYRQICGLGKSLDAIAEHLGLEIMEKVTGDKSPFADTPYKCVKKNEK